MTKKHVKVYGKITDFNGTHLSGAEVRLMNEKFEDIHVTFTDDEGRYEINAEKGVYFHFYACKDYKVNYLEYWAGNIPIYDDLELNAQIDGLEIYSLTAFPVKRSFPQLMLYFRPMSLKRANELEAVGNLNFKEKIVDESLKIIDISPELTKEDIEVQVNGEKSEVYEVNKVLEYLSSRQSTYSYLVHVSLNKDVNKFEYNKVHLSLFDRKTGERGEGSVFWREEETI